MVFSRSNEEEKKEKENQYSRVKGTEIDFGWLISLWDFLIKSTEMRGPTPILWCSWTIILLKKKKKEKPERGPAPDQLERPALKGLDAVPIVPSPANDQSAEWELRAQLSTLHMLHNYRNLQV